MDEVNKLIHWCRTLGGNVMINSVCAYTVGGTAPGKTLKQKSAEVIMQARHRPNWLKTSLSSLQRLPGLIWQRVNLTWLFLARLVKSEFLPMARVVKWSCF